MNLRPHLATAALAVAGVLSAGTAKRSLVVDDLAPDTQHVWVPGPHAQHRAACFAVHSVPERLRLRGRLRTEKDGPDRPAPRLDAGVDHRAVLSQHQPQTGHGGGHAPSVFSLQRLQRE